MIRPILYPSKLEGKSRLELATLSLLTWRQREVWTLHLTQMHRDSHRKRLMRLRLSLDPDTMSNKVPSMLKSHKLPPPSQRAWTSYHLHQDSKITSKRLRFQDLANIAMMIWITGLRGHIIWFSLNESYNEHHVWWYRMTMNVIW